MSIHHSTSSTLKELPPQASPAEWTVLFEHEVPVFRRLFCQHYPACLHYVAAAGWGGFTCVGCSQAPLAPLEAPPGERDTPTAIDSFLEAFAAIDARETSKMKRVSAARH